MLVRMQLKNVSVEPVEVKARPATDREGAQHREVFVVTFQTGETRRFMPIMMSGGAVGSSPTSCRCA